jgi:hypothetical protein
MYIMVFSASDMVFTNKGGKVTAGGYAITSNLLSNKESVCTTHVGQAQGGGGVGTILNGLAVPAGLLLLQQNMGKKYPVSKTKDASDVVSKSLYDDLLDLVSVGKPSTRSTRKQKPKARTDRLHPSLRKTKKRG